MSLRRCWARPAQALAQAVEVLLEAEGWSEDVRLLEVWEMIDAVVPHAQLRSAVATVTGLVPPPDAEDDGGWRAAMAGGDGERRWRASTPPCPGS
ncbi:hypothetical protein ACIBQ1_60900 [Nonomuraea sp. NPDC050153]|uniref:hypothetical protein n=1 Tax=Nonomuraea sp. NPDC050153 TaxID=3364359 RepID=UPI0037999F53